MVVLLGANAGGNKARQTKAGNEFKEGTIFIGAIIHQCKQSLLRIDFRVEPDCLMADNNSLPPAQTEYGVKAFLAEPEAYFLETR